MIKRLGLSIVFIMVLAIFTACGSSNDGDGEGTTSTDGETITIRMANQVDENNFLNQGYVKFKEIIEEKSEGKFQVEIYNGGTLVSSDEEIVEALKSGSIELSSSSAYGTANTTGVDGFKLFDMPMLIDDREEFYSLLDGEYGEGLKEQIAEKTNVEVLGYLDLGFYGVLNSEEAVEKPEDLKGLKIRSSSADLHLDTLSAMGANPTPMAYSEVFTGLQQGAIDGVSTTTPLIYGDRFFEVSKNMTLTNHVLLPHIFMVNKDFYNGLSDDMKTILDESVEEYITYARELSVKAEEEAVAGMEEEGVDVIELTDDQRKAFKESVDEVIEKHIDDIGQENYDKAMEQLGK